MPTPLLATKLFVPRPRDNAVLRPRLIARLNAGLRHHERLGRKLTLISAPAGFGKTTLVSAWVAGCARPVAWLSLDEGDNDALERANLFVFRMDSERRWYRYHHLLGDLLRTRLEQEASDLAPQLNRRAAAWYLHAGVGDAAMHHALATKDAAFAADIAQQFGVAMVGGSRLGAFSAWIARIELAAVAQRPYLLAGIAWTHVLTGHSAEALCTADAADAALASQASTR